jgi:hypothetical protein
MSSTGTGQGSPSGSGGRGTKGVANGWKLPQPDKTRSVAAAAVRSRFSLDKLASPSK